MKFTGVVKKHLGRGKELGFPTANIDAPVELKEDGLYLSWTVLTDPSINGRKQLQSLTFIGSNKTFNEAERVAEIYILDFDQDIYYKQIEVEIIQRLRGVIKFHSPSMLVTQMKNDVVEARKFFKNLV